MLELTGGETLRLLYSGGVLLRILIVEDEATISAFLQKGLKEEGFAVDAARSGNEALELASSNQYEVIVLDILLPGKNGFEVCSELRASGNYTPVLMLTALDSVDERVKGLNTGADDYLVKPFAFKELLARINALLRRPRETFERVLRVGDLSIDTVSHMVRRDDVEIELSPKEYRLLEYLARNAHQVLSRTQIAESVWDQDFFSDSNVVDVYIRYLRKKIDDPFSTKLINTVRGFGYRLG
ncbi:MAG TPA: response regulator transcription factor [Mesotoga sp.]|jgi:heavy metal response regulator|nr:MULTISPECIES: response regulator transcription factor [unclassified Mesotoga]MDD3461085.1 response regulator transcription factor [Mesotoga sp.]HNS34956.1 response regulator transcription factor [Mesotoga sp.]